jgi:hypothetical protein
MLRERVLSLDKSGNLPICPIWVARGYQGRRNFGQRYRVVATPAEPMGSPLARFPDRPPTSAPRKVPTLGCVLRLGCVIIAAVSGKTMMLNFGDCYS